MVNAAVPPAVKQSVSTALSGGVEEVFVEGMDGDESVMINTTAASVHAVFLPCSATCELNCGIC